MRKNYIHPSKGQPAKCCETQGWEFLTKKGRMIYITTDNVVWTKLSFLVEWNYNSLCEYLQWKPEKNTSWNVAIFRRILENILLLGLNLEESDDKEQTRAYMVQTAPPSHHHTMVQPCMARTMQTARTQPGHDTMWPGWLWHKTT